MLDFKLFLPKFNPESCAAKTRKEKEKHISLLSKAKKTKASGFGVSKCILHAQILRVSLENPCSLRLASILPRTDRRGRREEREKWAGEEREKWLAKFKSMIGDFWLIYTIWQVLSHNNLPVNKCVMDQLITEIHMIVSQAGRHYVQKNMNEWTSVGPWWITFIHTYFYSGSASRVWHQPFRSWNIALEEARTLYAQH